MKNFEKYDDGHKEREAALEAQWQDAQDKQALLLKIAEAAINEGWQDIETAPRDGKRILVLTKKYGPFTAHYENSTGFQMHTLTGINERPTHWKPLNGELDKLVAEYKERFGDE